MSSRVCSQCGCNDIDIDSARGDAVCTGCGSVLEDQIIVSEIQFQEGSGGVSSMVGQFVSTDGPKSLSLGGTFRGGLQKESRTITLQNGKKKIQHLAGQMKLNQMCVDRAFNFYKMAVSRRITRGRKLAHVVAACLYLVCRTERTPHMLLDFSDHLQVNVFVLGKTYLCLAKELCINMPEIDPCLYIPRFAHALEFGDKTHEVSMTAMRLVQRMKRDWMHTGRRPSGLCGAALLVAARIHDFSRTVKEIIKVVRVCQTTLKKRLMEFEDTPSSQLTIEEFQTIDLEEEHDPPSFTEGKRKLAKSKMLLEQNEKHMEEVERLQTEIDDLLVKQAPRGPWAAYAKMADDSLSIDSDVSRFSDLIEPEASRDSEKTTTSDTVSVESNCKSESHLQPDSQQDSDRTEDENPFKLETSKEAYENSNTRNDLVTNKLESSDNHSLSDNSVANRTKENSEMAKGDASSNKSVDNFSAIATELVVGSDDLVNSGETLKLPVKEGCGVPSIDMGMNEIMSDILKEGSDNSNDGQNCEGELDLEGLDDEELDRFILTEKEVLVKTKIWMEENADYLKAQKEKEERLAKEKEEEAKKPPEKKKRTYKKKPKVQYQEGQTAQEAIQKIMQEKKISSKINYDVLNDLTFNAGTSKKASKNTPDAGRPAITPVGPIFKNQAISALKSKILESQSEQPSAKKMKLPTLVPEVETMKQEEVVVESGPVQYHQKDDVYEEEEEAEDYYEEEEGHLSAAQLLGHTGTEEDFYEEMD